MNPILNLLLQLNSYYYYLSNYFVSSVVNYYLLVYFYQRILRNYYSLKRKILLRIRKGKRLKKKRTHWAIRKKYAKMLHENHAIPLDICNEIFYEYIY